MGLVIADRSPICGQKISAKPCSIVKSLNVLGFICFILLHQIASAESFAPPNDPLLSDLMHRCEQDNFKGLEATFTLAKYYPEQSMSACVSKIRWAEKSFKPNSPTTMKAWLVYLRALRGRDLKTADFLSRPLSIIREARAEIFIEGSFREKEKKALSVIKATELKGQGLYIADMISDKERLKLSWILPTRAQTLALSWRGQISISLDGEQLSQLEPKESLWLNDALIHLPMKSSRHSEERILSIILRPGSQVIPRILNDESDPKDRLWESLITRLDQNPDLMSDTELLCLSMISAWRNVDETHRVLPIIELDDRWNRKPLLDFNQALLALTPAKLRAQAWGDYPLNLGLHGSLKNSKSSRGSGRVNTHYQMLILEAFYDHLKNDRLLEAKEALDEVSPLEWLKEEFILAKIDLDRRLSLSVTLFKHFTEWVEQKRLFKSPRVLTALYTTLRDQDENSDLDKDLFNDQRLIALINDLMTQSDLSPSDIQLLTTYLLSEDPSLPSKRDLWRQCLQVVTKGDYGQFLWTQLYQTWASQKRWNLVSELDQVPPTPLHRRIKTKFQNLSDSVSKTQILGGENPWMITTPHDEREQQEASNSIKASVETLYQHIHYTLREGHLTKVERRILRPLNQQGVKSLLTLSVPHSPSRQTFTLERAQHLRPPSQSHYLRKDRAQMRPPPTSSQSSLSKPEERLYYDLIAEELFFDDLQVNDLIDVQWSLSERTPDPLLSLPHSDLIYLQDQTAKRCLKITMDQPIAHLLPHTQSLFSIKNRESCSNGATLEPKELLILSLSHVEPIVLEPLSPRGTSVNSYLHFSNIAQWDTVSTLYRSLIDPLVKPTEAVINTAKRWTASVKPWSGRHDDRTRFESEILEALYLELTYNIRYVGLEFGRHSYEPSLPELTIQRLSGDCKDRALLLMSLAMSLGIELHFVMARTKASGEIAKNGVASLSSFDHAFVYSPSLERYFDPTLPFYDPLILSSELHGAQILHVRPSNDGSKLAHSSSNDLQYIHAPPPEWVGDLYRVELSDSLNPIPLFLSLRGEEAMKVRKALSQEASEQRLNHLMEALPQLSVDELKQSAATFNSEPSRRDPLKLSVLLGEKINHFAEDREQLESISHRLQKIMGFSTLNELSLTSADRHTPTDLPLVRKKRCFALNIPHSLKSSLPSQEIKSTWGLVRQSWDQPKLSAHGPQVCFELILRPQLVPITEYLSMKSWIEKSEAALNRSMTEVIDTWKNAILKKR